MNTKTDSKTKTLVLSAMICAMAYVLLLVGRIPVVLFLKYDPKDIVIVIGGFLFGPLNALAVSCVVSLIEMLTISETGLIGFVMNVIQTASFACVASAVYNRRRTLRGAITGLVLGVVAMCATMMLWNYLITPLYMHVSRQEVAALLLPAFLPFNLIKGVLNAAATMLLYKPVVSGLARANLITPSGGSGLSKRDRLLTMFVSLFVLASAILCFLVLKGVI